MGTRILASQLQKIYAAQGLNTRSAVFMLDDLELEGGTGMAMKIEEEEEEEEEEEW